MESRSRKRRRGAARDGAIEQAPATPETVTAAPDPPQAPPDPPPAPPDPSQSPAEAMRRGYARGRDRDDALRASLEPLAPGERPRAVTVAAIVALIFAIANVAAALGGAELSAEEGNPVAVTAVTTAVLLVAAIGMWLRRYWAVLGFQVILALQIVVGSLALLLVEKLWVAAGLTILIGLLGWLFWKLVRAMARLQMPERPAERPRESTR